MQYLKFYAIILQFTIMANTAPTAHIGGVGIVQREETELDVSEAFKREEPEVDMSEGFKRGEAELDVSEAFKKRTASK
ncbi:uncharacterized protein F4822DRAFT_433115 [Hypoxylon trugodes]|uniref:uncharacterized protein n=1 Tax=Hypoxylon trugodes TaxID=326681 RepID=UPI0021970572|nr:uncharacterized protein F4822DRAFT_433115 [Hypoxylon trugodes]KAI1384573.1 hypothetical protein F4822DRAFT_433115 [Hypoxylon trugodes]